MGVTCSLDTRVQIPRGETHPGRGREGKCPPATKKPCV